MVLGVSVVLFCVNMPDLIVLAREESKPVKTLPPGVVGRSSDCGVEAPKRPFEAPFCCRLLNSDAVLVLGASSGLLTPLVWPKLPPLNRFVVDFDESVPKRFVLGLGVSVLNRLVLGLGVSDVDVKNDGLSLVG